jgi:hypothetical protein
VTHQVSGEWDARDTNVASYRFYVQQLSGFFEGYEFHHVPRANNDEADRVSKIGSTRQDHPQAIHQAFAGVYIHLCAWRPRPGSDATTGPRGCRLGDEGTSRSAQRGRLGERLEGLPAP